MVKNPIQEAEIKSKGYLSKANKSLSEARDKYLNYTYNMLTIKDIFLYKYKRGYVKASNCLCVCGNNVIKNLSLVITNRTFSCGCKKRGITDSVSNIVAQFNDYKHNAKRRNLSFEISRKQFETIIKHKCSYCDSNNKIGVDRVDSSKGYKLGNIIPCCKQCNVAKMNYSLEEFIKWKNELVSNKATIESIKEIANLYSDI